MVYKYKEEEEEESDEDGPVEAAEVLVQLAASGSPAVAGLGPGSTAAAAPGAATAAPGAAAAAGAGPSSTARRALTTGKSTNASPQVGVQVAVGLQVVHIHKHGSSRRARVHIKGHQGGIPRLLPHTDMPVSTAAERAFYAQHVKQYTSRGKVDYKGLANAFNKAFYEQLADKNLARQLRTNPAKAAQKIIHSKSSQHINAYHQQTDNAARARENLMFNAAPKDGAAAAAAAPAQGILSWLVPGQAKAAVTPGPGTAPDPLPAAAPATAAAAGTTGTKTGEGPAPEQGFSAAAAAAATAGVAGAGPGSSAAAAAAAGGAGGAGDEDQGEEEAGPGPGSTGLLAAAASAIRAVGRALSPVKRAREGGNAQEPPSKKQQKIIRCNACMLQLGVVRLKNEHASLPGKKCPAEGAQVKELQGQASSAMGWGINRKFSIPDYVLWWIKEKRASKGQAVGGPVQLISYSEAAFSIDVQHQKLGPELKKAKAERIIYVV